jgi:hypothetical protein
MAYTTRILIFSNEPSWLNGSFLLEDIYFLLEAKGLNDNEYFLSKQFN